VKASEMANLSGKMPKTGAIVPYSAHEIKVEKYGGKRTASIFCGTGSRSNGDRVNGQHEGGEVGDSSRKFSSIMTPSSVRDSASVTSVPSVATLESDVSDTFSVVSDLSDLSCMSGAPQSAAERTSRALAAVHGQGETRTRFLRRPRPPVDFSFWECQRRRQSFYPLKKADLVKLQEENFALKRENVNLKSRVESLLRHHQDQRVTPLSLTSEVVISPEEAVQDMPVELRRAARIADQEEMDRLRDSAVRCQNEAEMAQAQLTALQQTLQAAIGDVSASKNEAEALRKSKNRGDEALVRLQHKCQALEADLAAATESISWYKEQLKSHQKAKGDLQQDLDATRREASARLATLTDLEGKLEEAKASADSEREETASKLRRIEREVAEQEALAAEVHREKDAAIARLSEQLTESEDSGVDAVRCLSNSVTGMEAAVCDMRAALMAKERELEEIGCKYEAAAGALDVQSKRLEEAKEENAMLAKSRGRGLSELKAVADEAAREQSKCVDLFADRTQQSLSQMQTRLEELTYKSAKAIELVGGKLKSLERERDAIVTEKTDAIESLREQLDQALDACRDTKQHLHEKENEVTGLRVELKETIERSQRLSEEVRQYPPPSELSTLRQQALKAEQAEREAADLRLVQEEMKASKAAADEKMIEREKEAEGELEHLRQLLIEREDQLRQVSENKEYHFIVIQ